MKIYLLFCHSRTCSMYLRCLCLYLLFGHNKNHYRNQSLGPLLVWCRISENGSDTCLTLLLLVVMLLLCCRAGTGVRLLTLNDDVYSLN